MRRRRLKPWVRVTAGVPVAQAEPAAAALSALIEQTQHWAMQQRSVLSDVVSLDQPLLAWQHRPPDDAVDLKRGYRWYYHSHARAGHWAGEHGHFHIFADAGDGVVTHLVMVAVDARGQPLGLIAPNRWVTDERWQPAAWVLTRLRDFALDTPPRLRGVHRWLATLLQAFAPQLHVLLAHRDARLAAYAPRAIEAVFEDRRIAVLSRCAISISNQARLLERSLTRAPLSTGEMS